MSIHQIESEILEGRFWNGGLQDYPEHFSMNDHIFADLQPEREFLYRNRSQIRQMNHWLNHWFSRRQT